MFPGTYLRRQVWLKGLAQLVGLGEEVRGHILIEP